MKKQILMNKPVYLGFSIPELSKILMYEFWYVPKYDEKATLCYMDTGSFIVSVKNAFSCTKPCSVFEILIFSQDV